MFQRLSSRQLSGFTSVIAKGNALVSMAPGERVAEPDALRRRQR
jgi:hypothetical protein